MSVSVLGSAKHFDITSCPLFLLLPSACVCLCSEMYSFVQKLMFDHQACHYFPAGMKFDGAQSLDSPCIFYSHQHKPAKAPGFQLSE